ncbi:MAG: alpha,alpha-trehalose-phosphate synthase [Thiomonas sp. 14-64-326]|jgi:hydroxymethylpyrimidine pyrophosphatase-like HAD family hydrolase|nr:MAG: alpha,alpha-trehalose-phosphate synthase [Thiomonas sp. 14-64-326]
MKEASMPQTILATDLDGTFLGGNEAQRAALYEWVAQRRSEIVLIFVSGRGFDFMRQLARDLPVQPDHVIGDVGTSVATGADFAPIPAIDQWLDASWPADRVQQIDDIVRRHPELQPQPPHGGRRRSYFYRRPEPVQVAATELRRLGFDTLMSDNQYFDVLPRGVQKGSTLLRTLAALGLPEHRTLVAGDTLNDLSMFQTGLTGVAVSNREAALDHAITPHTNVYRSAQPGAAGVLDALQRFHQQGDFNGFISGHRLSQTTI